MDELPDPEPEMFLLAGVTVAGSCAPGEARAGRARAELQAAIAEKNAGGGARVRAVALVSFVSYIAFVTSENKP